MLDKKLLEIENKLRDAKGLGQVSTLDQLNESNNSNSESPDNQDVLLMEAGNILADSIILTKNQILKTSQLVSQ